MTKKNYLWFWMLALPVLGNAQDTLSVSKSDLLAKLTDKNLQIKIAQQAYQGALADYQSSNALFLPSITASHTGISTTNPLMAFGSKLNQAILTPADFNPALLNNPVRTQNFATTIEVLQPIINVDGLYGRQAAKAKTNAFLLQTQRTQEYVEFEVNKAFMQLQMAYQAVTVMQKALEVAQANGVLINNYFNQGLVQKTDVLMVDVRINELKNQLQMAKSNVQNASDYLAFLLNEDTKNKVYKPNQSLAVESLASASNVSLSDNRKDIQAMNLSVQAYKKMWQSAQMNFLPRLNAFGSYQMYDAQIFQSSAKGYLVGAQLSWNVFDGYKSIGKNQKAKADYLKADAENQQYKAQSNLELKKTTRQLTDLEDKVTTSQLAWQQSQEVFRIRTNRFKQGLEKTTDVLAAETQMVFKNLEYLQSVFEYNTTKDYLGFLTR